MSYVILDFDERGSVCTKYSSPIGRNSWIFLWNWTSGVSMLRVHSTVKCTETFANGIYAAIKFYWRSSDSSDLYLRFNFANIHRPAGVRCEISSRIRRARANACPRRASGSRRSSRILHWFKYGEANITQMHALYVFPWRSFPERLRINPRNARRVATWSFYLNIARVSDVLMRFFFRRITRPASVRNGTVK